MDVERTLWSRVGSVWVRGESNTSTQPHCVLDDRMLGPTYQVYLREDMRLSIEQTLAQIERYRPFKHAPWTNLEIYVRHPPARPAVLTVPAGHGLEVRPDA
jgi:hypothetical protein